MKLVDFLDNPVIEIRVCDSKVVEDLRLQNEKLISRINQLEILYSQECQFSMRYRDLLLENNIPLR